MLGTASTEWNPGWFGSQTINWNQEELDGLSETIQRQATLEAQLAQAIAWDDINLVSKTEVEIAATRVCTATNNPF